MKIGLLVVAGMSLTLPPPATAATPRFDCRQARRPVEQLVCQDDDIAAAETLAATAWRDIRAKLKTDPDKTRQLLENQKVWLDNLPANCGFPTTDRLPILLPERRKSCLIDSYRERAADLKAMPTAPAPPGSPPFVGCTGSTNGGAILPPPVGNPPPVDLPPTLLAKIAYYASPFGSGGFAPRGWTCEALLGSSGDVLYAYPAATGQDHGPRLVVGRSEAGTSGRYSVAEFLAAFLPAAYPAFVAETKTYMEQQLHETFRPMQVDGTVVQVAPLAVGFTDRRPTDPALSDEVENGSLDLVDGDGPDPDLRSLELRLPKGSAALARTALDAYKLGVIDRTVRRR